MASADEFHYEGEHVYRGTLYPGVFPAHALRRIEEELEFHDQDIIIAAYPKSGTTWVQEICYWLLHGREAAEARETSLHTLFPFLEDSQPNYPTGLDAFLGQIPPRCAKTHLRPVFFSRQLQHDSPCPKFVVVMREPKDTLVSYYHFHRMIAPINFKRSFEEFFEMYKNKRVSYGDVIDHNLAWWQYRDHPRVHVVLYEDLKKDTVSTVNKLAEFLGRPIQDEEAHSIAEFTSFDSMKSRGIDKFHKGVPFDKNESSFFRQGKVGDWRSCFTEEQAKFVDDSVAKRYHPVGLHHN